MKKKMKRLLALVLSLVTIASCCVMPMAVSAEDEQFTSDYDTVTLEKLGITGSTIANGEYSYAGTSETYSVVFQFGWEPNYDNGGQLMMALDGSWDLGCFAWFQSNQTNLYIGGSATPGDAVASGKHNVEFGRLRVTAGANAGKDYQFIKIDGDVLIDGYAEPKASPAYKICFDDAANQVFSEFENNNAEKLTEDYDLVNLAGLGITGSSISAGTYGYEGDSATDSVIFQFGWDVNLTGDSNDLLMMSLDGSYNLGCYAWFKKDGTSLYAETGKDAITVDAIASGRHDVEFGRLRVEAGENEGKDYKYIKVDGNIIASAYVAPSANAANNIYFDLVDSKQTFYEVGTSEADKLTEDYDLVNLAGLGITGSTISAGTYGYEGDSATDSVIFQFGWDVNLTGDSNDLLMMSLDGSYNLGCYAWFKKDGTSLYAETGKDAITVGAVTSGKHEIEFGRLRVESGEHAGMDYKYIKVDKNIIADAYVAPSANADNNIYFDLVDSKQSFYEIGASTADKLTEDYDLVNLADLGITGSTISAGTYSYDGDSATDSVIFRFGWEVDITGDSNDLLMMGLDGSYNLGCYAWFKKDGISLYAETGKDAITKAAITSGKHDVEFGRLRVESGEHAGLDYKYIKIDGDVIADAYVTPASNSANKIYFDLVDSKQRFYEFGSGGFEPETYEDYVEIGYSDLKQDGKKLSGKTTALDGATVLTYDKTSATGSAILKYRWTVGSEPTFQLSFDKASSDSIDYMFGAWLSKPGEEGFADGRMWLRPGYGPQVDMGNITLPKSLVTATSHNVEFARLKVKTGANAGMYYVYLKIDDVMIAESYVDASVVAANGKYTSEPNNATCNVLSKEIMLEFWGSTGNEISAYKKEDLSGKTITITVDVMGEVAEYQAIKGEYFMPATPQVAMGKLFKGFYNGKTKYDGYSDTDIKLVAKFEDIEYETYDTISLKDLGITEKKIKNKANSVYHYEKTAESGGRLFQFILEPIKDMNSGDGLQVTYANDWEKIYNAMVWFQNNTATHIYSTGEAGAPTITRSISLEAGKQYKVQYAIRVMKNEGYEGKKIFEVSIDGELLVQYIGSKADLSDNVMFLHGGTGSAYLINDPAYQTVKFYNGNTLIATKKVERSSLLPKMDEPSPKNGLPFAGWSTKKSGGEIWDENVELVYQDLSLYAQFADVKKITALIDGKTFIYRVPTGKTLDEIPKPLKQGHVFVGWKYNGSIFTGKVTKAMTVTAVFEAYSFEPYDEISLRDLGISGSLDVAIFGNDQSRGYTYYKAAENGGRVFKGIYVPTENMSNGPQVSFSNSWDENYFAKIYFRTLEDCYIYSTGNEQEYTMVAFDTPLVAGKGYTFEIGVRVLNNKGYKGVKVLTVYLDGKLIFEQFDNQMNLDGSTVFFQGLPKTGIFKNVNIYNKVSFYNGEKLLSTVSVLRGSMVEPMDALEDQGDWLFKGWVTEFGKSWDFDTEKVYLDMIFKARFEKRTYPVLLMVDGVLYKRLNIYVGEAASIYDVPTKEGYVFDKWLLEDGSEYDMSTPVKEKLTLVASFKEAPKDTSAGNDAGVIETNWSTLLYVLFGVLGLAVIGAETGVIVYKKRKNK